MSTDTSRLLSRGSSLLKGLAKHPANPDFIIIEWMRMQNPLVPVAQDTVLLPGQEYASLGEPTFYLFSLFISFLLHVVYYYRCYYSSVNSGPFIMTQIITQVITQIVIIRLWTVDP